MSLCWTSWGTFSCTFHVEFAGTLVVQEDSYLTAHSLRQDWYWSCTVIDVTWLFHFWNDVHINVVTIRILWNRESRHKWLDSFKNSLSYTAFIVSEAKWVSGTLIALFDIDLFIVTVSFPIARRSSANILSESALIFCVSWNTWNGGQNGEILKQMLVVAWFDKWDTTGNIC